MSEERNGRQVVQSSGPVDAEIVLISDSPTYHELKSGQAIAGRAANVLSTSARAAGLSIEHEVRVINLVPIRPLGDKWENHSIEDRRWGLQRARDEISSMPNVKVIVPLGDVAMHCIAGFRGDQTVTDWRGSAFRASEVRHHSKKPEDYMSLAGIEPDEVINDSFFIMPTLKPEKVAANYTDHPWLIMDLERARRLAAGDEKTINRRKRKWFFNDLPALQDLARRIKQPTTHEGILAFDTESSPYYIIGLVVDDEVHVFKWDEAFRETAVEIFASEYVIKVAHNLQHDLSFNKKKLGIDVALPWFDTMGGANILNNALPKSLSPAIATRYTNWPFHKWLVQIDPLLYNGMDNVVAYDAYQPQIDQLHKRKLYEVAKHDHLLLQPLIDMQWYGFKVDEDEQRKALEELTDDTEKQTGIVAALVGPVVASSIGKFKKPHLFQVQKQCEHCGGGKNASQHCWRCAGLEVKPEGKNGYASITLPEGTKRTVANLKVALPQCAMCGGTGKILRSLPFNPDSGSQVGDVLYRGLGIKARKYKGTESVRVGLLEPLAEKYPLVRELVTYARVNADKETVERLSPGMDGRLHCVFDPFGTESGRVASKEGLIEIGTNAMNIPKKARRLVVPDKGKIFLYPDMKAVEGRAIAVLSKDKQLIDIFNDPTADMHVIVRDDIRKLGFTVFSRDQAKRLEYATFYGGSPKQIAVELNNEALQKGEGISTLTEAQVKLMQDALLMSTFRGIQRWHDDINRELLANRRITSPTGRQRIWTDYIYDKKTKGVKNEIIKQGYSFGPQDIGAWVLGDGMVRAYRGDWNRFRGLIHVHDALLFQAKVEDEEEAKAVLSAQLSTELWGMKFLTEMKTGKNWKEAS